MSFLTIVVSQEVVTFLLEVHRESTFVQLFHISDTGDMEQDLTETVLIHKKTLNSQQEVAEG